MSTPIRYMLLAQHIEMSNEWLVSCSTTAVLILLHADCLL